MSFSTLSYVMDNDQMAALLADFLDEHPGFYTTLTIVSTLMVIAVLSMCGMELLTIILIIHSTFRTEYTTCAQVLPRR